MLLKSLFIVLSASAPIFAHNNYPWVGNFQDLPSCSDNASPVPSQPRPEIYQDCAAFTPAGDWIGIYFGSGVNHCHSVTLYTDNKCTNTWNGTYTAALLPNLTPGPEEQRNVHMPSRAVGPGTCINSTDWGFSFIQATVCD